MHIIMLIISINVVTLLHYILTNFALLEYPVLEYVLTKSEDIFKVNCNAMYVKFITALYNLKYLCTSKSYLSL
jgi:hypothetical protein